MSPSYSRIRVREVELRRMRHEPPESPHFGEPFLWTALFCHDAHA
ncbi:MAG: hypothetical protein ACRDSO_13650 [Pseudonocardiaceae bacterium]